MGKDRLTKRDRLQITNAIEDTLGDYCRVCPNSGGNNPSSVCALCPINSRLQEYGKRLSSCGVRSAVVETYSANPWSEKEDAYAIRAFSNGASYAKIASELNRTIASVNMRLRRLRKEGRVGKRVCKRKKKGD